MRPNFIIAEDVREAIKNSRMVQIKCKSCNGGLIGNHISIIADHLSSGLKLHDCPTCGAKTKLHPEDVIEIKNILKIGCD